MSEGSFRPVGPPGTSRDSLVSPGSRSGHLGFFSLHFSSLTSSHLRSHTRIHVFSFSLPPLSPKLFSCRFVPMRRPIQGPHPLGLSPSSVGFHGRSISSVCHGSSGSFHGLSHGFLSILPHIRGFHFHPLSFLLWCVMDPCRSIPSLTSGLA
jgi:hypothetical protein